MSGKSSKGETYAAALDEARRQGRWHEKISTPAASGLPWSELVRKFAKHNPTRTLTAEAAKAEQLAYAALQTADSPRQVDERAKHDVGYASFSEAGPLRHVDLDQPRLVAMSERDDLRQASDSLLAALRQAPNSEEANSARLVSVLCFYVLSEPDNALDAARQCDRAHSSNASESHEASLKIMSMCIEGRCYEMKGELERAEAAYADASATANSQSTSPSSHTGTIAFWLEDALYRLALLAAYRKDYSIALPAHRSYHSLTKKRSPSAAPHRRSAFYRSYLALLRDAHRDGQYHQAQQSRGANGGSNALADAAWRHETRQVEHAYIGLIEGFTAFPRAGLLNQPMLDFVDHVYDSWVAGGRKPEDAPEAIEIHYRAIERTFQSQRILRHLVHLLDAVGNYDDAERTLRLYDQLFSKAKETDAREVAREVLAFYEKSGDAIEGGKGANQPDFDTDEQYVGTVVFGVRMLCRHRRSIPWACELADKLERFTKDHDSLLGEVEYARGMARAALADFLADADSRLRDQESALRHLRRAVELDSHSLEKRYLLAHLQTEMRDVQGATATARAAVEMSNDRPEVWHLLVLLTSATRDYEGALGIADLALDSSDVDGASVSNGSVRDGDGFATPPERLATPSPGLAKSANGNGSAGPRVDADDNKAQSGAYSYLPPPVGQPFRPHASGTNGDTTQTHTGPSELTTPALKQHLTNIGNAAAPPRSSSVAHLNGGRNSQDTDQLDADGLEAELQLRITRNALIEIIEGPEAALQDQQGLFALFAQISPRLASVSAHLMSTTGTGAPHATETPLASQARHASTAHGHSKDGDVARKASLRLTSSRVAASRVAPGPPTTETDNGFELVNAERSPSPAQKTSNAVSQQHGDRARGLLVRLWLLSAATFRRWGKVEEGRAAIEAAEALDPEHPSVWIQLALYDLAVGDRTAASTALTKALAFAPGHGLAMTELGKLHVLEGELALAEAALEEATQGRGWANGAAWRALGGVCAKTDRPGRARRCLEYALSLEQSRPVRNLDDAVPRIL